MSRKLPLFLPALASSAVILLLLSWNDVLPGSWKLHGWFEAHHHAAYRAQARRAWARIRTFEEQNARTPPGSVVFLGSSTIERFPLEECFPARPCVNRGIGNEPAPELARRLARSLPPEPAGAVVFTARVDWLEGQRSASEIARRVEPVLRALRERGLETLLIGLLPKLEMTASEVQELAQTNRELQILTQKWEAGFADLSGEPFTTPSGQLAPEVAEDALHLNPLGYRYLAQLLTQTPGPVGRLLRPDGASDL